MTSETKTCQNCKQSFVIEPDDFTFYEKVKVPAPTWCPHCRMVRRQLFRNERTLYKTNCALCKKGTLSMYAPEKEYTVYCTECYASDKWDPLSYGVQYDFGKPLLSQFKELMRVVPRRALYQDFASNSEYTNMSVYMNNSYLCFGGHHYEDSQYCAQNFYLANCIDTDFSMKSDFCYDSLHLRRCNRVYFSSYSEDCTDSWLLFGCRNCHDCIGCTNLRNASYCILNEQFSKEEFEKKAEELNLKSRKSFEEFKKRFEAHTLRYPRKYAWVRNVVNSTGDDLEQVRDCIQCFSATDDENCRYSFFVPTGAKDSYDLDHVGLGTENSCELHSAFAASHVLFGNRVYYSHDIYYSDDCYNCSNLFGCIGLRKKEYCILNTQYSKEEYEKLLPQVIDHMNAVPFLDVSGIEYRFGEFFPAAVMPFAYNETVAQEYFPLTKESAVAQGFSWRDTEARNYSITMEAPMVPDSISDVTDDILKAVIGCAHRGTCEDQCTTAFRLTSQELEFYRHSGVPLPTMCPNCRHAERLRKMNSMRLFERSCECVGATSRNGAYQNDAPHFHGNQKCSTGFQTPFSPARPEFIYCEQCYQAEVA
ncbi:MAG: hypothetical protein V1885_00300 [Candidatus Brennerbacteria bacterium]